MCHSNDVTPSHTRYDSIYSNDISPMPTTFSRSETGLPAWNQDFDTLLNLPEPDPDELDKCRYCLSDDRQDELKQPCACRGDQAYVHGTCLQLWQESMLRDIVQEHGDIPARSKAGGTERHMKCHVCLKPFKMGSSQAKAFSFDDYAAEMEGCDAKDHATAVIASAPWGTELNFSRLDLTSLPATVTFWTHLTRLDLSRNKLVHLPGEVIQLQHLKWLSLKSNEFRELPNVFDAFHELMHLDLCGNYLSELPSSFCKLSPHLQLRVHQECGNNPESFKPPQEIVRAGIFAIRQYFKQMSLNENSTPHGNAWEDQKSPPGSPRGPVSPRGPQQSNNPSVNRSTSPGSAIAFGNPVVSRRESVSTPVGGNRSSEGCLGKPSAMCLLM